MRSCLVRRRCWLSASHLTRPPSYTLRPLPICTKLSSPAGNTRGVASASPTKRIRTARDARSRIPDGPDAWIALLNLKLPQHGSANNAQLEQSDKDTEDIADIILAAQRLAESGNGIDLLYHLGVKQGRWRTVVWLVKYMVETVALSQSQPGRLSATLGIWSSKDSLDDITFHRLGSDHPLSPHKPASLSQSLDELTGGNQPEDLRRDSAFRHEVLGSIWRSIGLMSIACVDSEMIPEILEIIAYLHHMEVMPASIYNQTSSVDVTALQQPPMLRLFSSTILTSLSDAAWRAHEKTTVEEERAKSGQNSTAPPDIPGAAVRMTSPGLRPEVWIELILWSCLHGGWILEGAATLRAIYSEPQRPRWKPLSWSSVFRTTDTAEDWDKLSYLFNSRSPKRRESLRNPSFSARKTVSSEVVNAYVDALLATVRSGVGKRGAAPSTVLEYLALLQKLLQRAGLGLQNGSWDAIVLRFLEAQDTVIDQGKNFEALMNLSPGLGDGLKATNQDNVPQYVLDGSAVTLGLFHRALKSRIARGDTQGAVRLFECLQNLADQNKQRSLVDFFQKSRLLTGSDNQSNSNMFTSNFPGIEYPGFNIQIPPTILGPFLELLTDAKAYDWGKWLLYNDDGFDEPVLPERHYNHPAIAPTLVRFAAETRDSALLEKAIQARATIKDSDGRQLSGNVIQSFIESQINLNNWHGAERALQHEKGLQPHSLNTVTIAHLIRSMLFQVRGQRSIHLQGAKDLLSNIVHGKYDGDQECPQSAHQRVTLLLVVLATVDKQWSEYCLGLRPLHGVYTFTVTAREFNLILEGVVQAYGSAAGRRLLDRFWHEDARKHQTTQFEAAELVMSKFEPHVLHDVRRQRSVTAIAGRPDINVVVYGGLRPNVATMRIILRQAIEERSRESSERPVSPQQASETIVWAADALHTIQETDALESAKVEIQNALSRRELDAILHRLPGHPNATHLVEKDVTTEDNANA